MSFQLWKFIHDSKNHEILSWLGGGAVVVVAGIWAAIVYSPHGPPALIRPATASVAIVAPSFEPHQGWKLVPSIVVVSAEGDPRLPLVGDAVAFWNNTLSELGSGFRLGALTQMVGTIP